MAGTVLRHILNCDDLQMQFWNLKLPMITLQSNTFLQWPDLKCCQTLIFVYIAFFHMLWPACHFDFVLLYGIFKSEKMKQ